MLIATLDAHSDNVADIHRSAKNASHLPAASENASGTSETNTTLGGKHVAPRAFIPQLSVDEAEPHAVEGFSLTLCDWSQGPSEGFRGPVQIKRNLPPPEPPPLLRLELWMRAGRPEAMCLFGDYPSPAKLPGDLSALSKPNLFLPEIPVGG
jgi:hypothetical protein